MIEYESPRSPDQEQRRKRALRTFACFAGVLGVGVAIRIFFGGMAEGVAVFANWITVLGFLGAAWWGSVLFDVSNSARKG